MPDDDDRAPRHGSRRDARRRALEILYEADLKGAPVPTVLSAHLAGEDPPVDYAVALVRGVHRDAARIDELIAAHAKGWTLERMPIVDRNLLRIGVHELRNVDEVPTAVAINEAVDLAKELSTDDSGRFVNGVLAGIAAAETPEPPTVSE